MTHHLWAGLALALAAGVLSGHCMLPMKFAKRWRWENLWLVFSLVSLVILPWSLALWQIPDLQAVYSTLPLSAFAAPLAFGAGWGIAQTLFGLSMARLGLALGYAIIIGLGALLGTLVPLLIKSQDVLGTTRGSLILSGVAVMAAGIAVSAWAGQQRERSAGARVASGSYAAALAIAVVCGLMAPMLNYAFAFGQDIAQQAVQRGATLQAAGYAVWPIALLGGLAPNVAYPLWLLRRNGTWKLFRQTWRQDVWLAFLMAILWMGAVALYGVSSAYLGALGTSAGWALFQIFMIMTANVSGILAGEWRSAPPKALRTLWIGLALLAAATALIAEGNRRT